MGKKNKEVKNKINEIAKQLMDNLDSISSEIDEEFEKREDSIIQYISFYMCNRYGSKAEDINEYEWYYDDCPYDHSGELKKVGFIHSDITVEDFFDHYTGYWTPTFESGRGKHWETFLDNLSYETLDVGESIMWHVLNKKIEAVTDELNDDEFWMLRDEIHDEFYDNTKTYLYFWGPNFSEDILNMTYNDFIALSADKRRKLLLFNNSKFSYNDFYKIFYSE